jgi:hypothetical protein
MATQAPDGAVEAQREPNFLLANPERRLLRWIAARLPRWILPDDLTAVGVLSAFAICAAYQLSNHSLDWLWVASALLVVHWLGDSLDGTLARVRHIERPTYGITSTTSWTRSPPPRSGSGSDCPRSCCSRSGL